MVGTMRNKTMVITKYPNDFILKLRSYKCNAGKLPKVPLVTNYTALKEMLWCTYRRELTEIDIEILALEIHDYIMENNNVLDFESKESITNKNLEQLEASNVNAYYCNLSEKQMKEVYNIIHYVKAHQSTKDASEKVTENPMVVSEATETGKIKMGRRLKTKESKDEVSKEATKEVKSDEQGETKHEKFMRLATKDKDVLIDRLRQLRNKANTSTYEYTEEDVQTLFAEIQRDLDHTMRTFEDKLKNKRRRRS